MALAVVLALSSIAAGGFADDEQPKRTTKESGCVTYWAEARYIVAGYHHYVVLESGCDKPVVCEVWTNVNPQHESVALEPKSRREVLTFRESPARVFTPFASCGERASPR